MQEALDLSFDRLLMMMIMMMMMMIFKPLMDLTIKLAVLWIEYVVKHVRWKATGVSYVVAYFASVVPNYNRVRRRISEDYWITLKKRYRSR